MITCTPEEERQARALCRAHGFNPDALVTFDVQAVGPKGLFYVPPPDRAFPAWETYVYDLRAAKALLATEKAA